jgi:tRNA threonylcarbamoyl adenosine modification protein YjeE
MNTTLSCICPSETATSLLAQNLSQVTVAGDVWALFGTLGMGKSVFSRAFIQSLCGLEDVPSPTFTLVQTYETPAFDLYRLKSPEEIWELNIEEAVNFGVCLIEWPEKAGPYLPRRSFRLEIESEGENARKISLTVPDGIDPARFDRIKDIFDAAG